jgi:hypothetical protein
MPHPKNRLKLTGDTRLPDMLDYLGDDDEVIVAVETIATPTRIYADGYVPPAMTDAQPPAEPAGPLQEMERRVRTLPARWPWLAAGAGIFLGWMVAKSLRR